MNEVLEHKLVDDPNTFPVNRYIGPFLMVFGFYTIIRALGMVPRDLPSMFVALGFAIIASLAFDYYLTQNHL